MMNTSRPRALRSMRTKISPSAKFRIDAEFGFSPRICPISAAKGGLARPPRSRSGPLRNVSSMDLSWEVAPNGNSKKS